MSNLGDKIHTMLPPDRQAFDEIRITTVPRYKTSGMSGDEWRISAQIDFYYKGEIVHTEGARNVSTAIELLQWYHIKNTEPIPYNPSDFWDKYCNQEGCKKEAVYTYKVKNFYCERGEKHETFSFETSVRKFCEEHKRRGDCGLEDADANYKLLENKNSN